MKNKALYKAMITFVVLTTVAGIVAQKYMLAPKIESEPQVGDRRVELETYRNPEIGITFEYPKHWGALKNYRGGPCNLETVKNTADPCVEFFLYPELRNDQRPAFKIFFYTQTPEYEKHKVARRGPRAPRACGTRSC